MDDQDSAEWTDEEIAKARLATEVLPAWAIRGLVRGNDDLGTTGGLKDGWS